MHGLKRLAAVGVGLAAIAWTTSPASQAAPAPKVSVAIGSPTAGATVSGTVTVSGTAGSRFGIASVTVSVDGATPQTATLGSNGTWSLALATGSLRDGSHTLTAVATDRQHNTAQAREQVTVSNAPPLVSIASPASGAVVSGRTSVSGSASSTAGVTSVQIRVDNGAWQPASGTATWSASVDTTALAYGTHTLTAQATDSLGRTGSASITVTVDNRTATSSTPWFLADSTGSVSTVNETMGWNGDTQQSSPLPTGTIVLQINDTTTPNDPSDTCTQANNGWQCVHVIGTTDYQWMSATGWSLHYAFQLGAEYPASDTWTVSYSGDSTFAPSSAPASNT